MTASRLAYMPLATYPEAVEDGAIRAAIGFAASIGCALHVEAFAVDLPRVSSGLGDYLINIPGIIQAAEERSRAECERLQGLVREASASQLESHCRTREVPLGAVLDAAASEARYCDLTLLPWSAETGAVSDMVEAIVFGSGRPAIWFHPLPILLFSTTSRSLGTAAVLPPERWATSCRCWQREDISPF